MESVRVEFSRPKVTAIAKKRSGHILVSVGKRRFRIRFDPTQEEGSLLADVDGKLRRVSLEARTESKIALSIDGRRIDLLIRPPRIPSYFAPGAVRAELGQVVAPIPGRVVSIEVGEGDYVKAGAPLVVIEAMKMESVIRSTKAGRVGRILVKKGDSVRKNQPLLLYKTRSVS